VVDASFVALLRNHYDLGGERMNDLRERGNYPLEHSTIETHAVPERGYTVTTVQRLDPHQLRTVPAYDVRTSSDRIDEINAQVAELRAELRRISEQMQAVTA
jgi:hypothetical protein